MNLELQKVIQSWGEYAKSESLSSVKRNFNVIGARDLASALIGVRRSGKTTIAIQTVSKQTDNYIYINFEDPFFSLHSNYLILDELIEEYINLYNKKPEYIVYDEIHNIKGWEKWARKFIDLKKSKLIITGSSAKMLSGELSTSLTGRNLTSEVWPLNFKEYIEFKKIKTADKDDLLMAFNDFTNWGGFPRVVLEEDEKTKLNLLRQYFTDAILKDVVQRNEIRDVNSLMTVFNFYLANISSLHSYTSIKNAFGLSAHAPAAYSQALHEAFLLFEVKLFSKNLKVQSRNPRKVYSIDTGFRNANATSSAFDYGKLLENAVYLELRKQGHEIYYHRGVFECDFVLTKKYAPFKLIQVTETLAAEPTKLRELSGLSEAMKKYKINEGLIITRNEEGRLITPEGVITVKPAWKYFLE